MNLDDIMELDRIDRAALARLADRLRGSSTFEHFVYREAELDEAWRLIDMALARGGDPPRRSALEKLRGAVAEAHDLVGVEHRPTAAAVRLDEAVLAGHADIEGIGAR